MTSPGASNFNPSPLEWVVFTAGLNAAHGAAHSFMDTAVATNWGVWYFDKRRYKPSWLIPEAYACARYFSALTVGVAWWLGMREIIRSQFAPSETDEGVATPSNHYVFLFNLFWIIYVFLSRSFSSSFFIHGLGKGYMASPFFNEVCIFACVVTMGVFGGLIWYPVGILLAFPMAFYLVSIALLISFWAYNNHPKSNPDYVFRMFKTVYASRNPQSASGVVETELLKEAEGERTGVYGGAKSMPRSPVKFQQNP
jgi:hypothetical protein